MKKPNSNWQTFNGFFINTELSLSAGVIFSHTPAFLLSFSGFLFYRHLRTLFLYCHPRALRGDPARETSTFLKFFEISEIKDFEDDGGE